MRVELGAAQRDPPLAVAGGVHPADRPGVAAAVQALDLADDRHRRGGRGTAHRGRRVQRLDQSQRAGAVGDDRRDDGRQVHDVLQVQQERLGGHVDTRAVGRQGVRDRPHGVRVLLQVLVRVRQRAALHGVPEPVVTTTQGPGEHQRGHDAFLEPHEQLRGGADQAVDREGPAPGVALGQPLQRPPDVERLVELGLEVAGQHDLGDLPGPDPLHDTAHHRRPLGRRPGAVAEAHRSGWCGRPGRLQRGLLGVDRRHPPAAGAVPHDDARHHQGRRAGLGVEGEGAEGDQPAAGGAHLVGDGRGGDQVAPPLLGDVEAAAAGDLEAGGLAPADQALLAAHPRQRALGGQQVEQRAGVGDAHGGDRQQRELRRDGHTTEYEGPGLALSSRAREGP